MPRLCFFLFMFVYVAAIDEEWFHCTILDPEEKYNLCWKFSNSSDEITEITFRVDVQTHGYVGLGLSADDSLVKTDIFTGWVNEEIVYFQDRQITDNYLSKMDSASKWELLHGNENDTHTSFILARKIDTCDDDEIPFNESIIKVFYYYDDEDPIFPEELQYHADKKGFKNINFRWTKNQQNVDKEQFQYLEFVMNYTINSEDEWMLWCSFHKSPTFENKYHAVLGEPLIPKGRERNIHHIKFYECVGNDLEEYEYLLNSPGFECGQHNFQFLMRRCSNEIFRSSAGLEDDIFPENAGLPLDYRTPTYYILSIHYENPLHQNVSFNNSGIRFYYTPNLRKYDVGSILIGLQVSPKLFIPPNQRSYVLAGHSDSKCLDEVIPKDGIKIYGVSLHAHMKGHSLKARHFRNKKELSPLAENKNFDFYKKKIIYPSEEVAFFLGDQITMECAYDTSDVKDVTFFGNSNQEEMCLINVRYYPRIDVINSVSEYKMEEINKALGSNFTEEDVASGQFKLSLGNYIWDLMDVKKIENSLRYSQQAAYCEETSDITTTVSYPADFEPYEETTCSKSVRAQEEISSLLNIILP